MSMKPTKGGMRENIMKYMRRLLRLLVTRPMRTKYRTDRVLLGMSRRMTWRFVKPKFVLMMEPNVVRPPLGTEDKKALMPANQN